MMKNIPILFFILFCYSCTITHETTIVSQSKLYNKNRRLDYKELENWQHKDILEDTIPGISLDKAYRELLKDKKSKKIIVALLDTGTDIYHEDLKDIIWVNPKEIPGNGIDDDNNGYVDDIHGWNFLGNQNGDNIIYSNLESTRVINYYKNKFKNNKLEDVLPDEKKAFLKYQTALSQYKEVYDLRNKDKKIGDSLYTGYLNASDNLREFFPKKQYTIDKLDSLLLITTENKNLSDNIVFMKDFLKKDFTEEWLLEYNRLLEDKFNTIFNEHYLDRNILGDNPDDLSDINYGNNNVAALAERLQHGTKVAGVLGAIRDNQLGINGVSNSIELMILPVAAYASENDKDVALAIQYAVDNGAKIINLSIGKRLSLHENWITEAIKYAENHDVLIVSGAGNDSVDLDVYPFFPTDVDENGEEFSSNFIKVGSISYYTKEWFVSYFSNYGKKNVDLFAPGHDLFTTVANNKYEFDSGTSLSAPIVSGVAALIRSYYPTLTAAEVKSIILESGISYDIMVNRPAENGSNDKVHFSELSKSGKVVNAYNALLMAKEIAKKKK